MSISVLGFICHPPRLGCEYERPVSVSVGQTASSPGPILPRDELCSDREHPLGVRVGSVASLFCPFGKTNPIPEPRPRPVKSLPIGAGRQVESDGRPSRTG